MEADEQRPAEGRRDDAGRLGAGADPGVWEIFRQEKDGDPMRHAGNVRAPDRELAMHYAREFYSRRNESVRLWVVARTEITDVSDPDLLQDVSAHVEHDETFVARAGVHARLGFGVAAEIADHYAVGVIEKLLSLAPQLLSIVTPQ